ncbi:MAG TPA: M4 family metallopeptidase [Thermoanaerobaculia bacterium]|nr:M4 family metallopeptidase [Thermoanaerobaculia bacterium]
MIRTLLAAILILVPAAGAAWAQAGSVEVRARDARGVPTFLAGDLGTLGADAASGARAAVRSHAGLLGASGRETFEVRSVTHDELGQAHVRLQQTLAGRRVYGGDVVVHGDAAGRVFALNGRIAAEDGLSSRRPRLDPARAVVDAAAEIGIYRWQPADEPELAYWVDADTAATLVWTVLARYRDGEGNPRLDRLFVDAESGRLVATDSVYQYARNRRTYTANNGTSLPGSLVLTETSGSTSDAAINAAHTYAGVTYDYYLGVHGRDSFDGAGATITSTVHYSSNYNNAFWNGSQMVYGDGDGTTFTHLSKALDVDAHELTHAVTDYTADLVYQKEPGALNEGMSDVFAAAAEAWYRGGIDANTWKIGEDIYTPGTAGDALRYMDDPTADGYSRDYYPERLYSGSCTPSQSNDYCGVHGNSGIANLAFQLLVSGGTHPRGKTSVSVPALGMAKAERIFYRALTLYMTSSTTFEGARTATAQAATDLYGSTETAAVHKAWDAVGVPGTSGGGSAELQNGVPVSNLSGASGSEQRWTMAVPSGASNLVFQISGGSGDADLYVKYGTAPTTSSWDCRPYRNGNSESCSWASPSAGTWHVMLRGYTSYSGVTLQGSYATAAPNNPPTASFTFTTSGLTASFTDASSDSDGTIASRSWSFGDGTTSTSTNPSKTYAAGGIYTVTLTVTDDDGATASTSKSVTVTAPAPSCDGTLYTGTLSGTGDYDLHPDGTYYYSSRSGYHTGTLDGPSGPDFDLRLYKWSGSSWGLVKSSLGSTADEYINYYGSSGYYYWKIDSYSGSGSYTFCLKRP